MRRGAPPDRVLMRPGQHRDRLAQLAVGGQAAVQVGVHAQDVRQRHRVGVIGLRPCHRVALPVTGHRQRVDRIHRPSRRPQRRDQQPPRRLDCHRNGVLAVVAEFGEQLDELGEARRIVGDTFLGDQLTAAVDDCDIVTSRPSRCHRTLSRLIPPIWCGFCAGHTRAGCAALYLQGSMAFPPMSCSRSQQPARRRSMLRAPRLEKTETFLRAGGLQPRGQSHRPAPARPSATRANPVIAPQMIPIRGFARARP